jgi:hypothetical protein
MHDEGMVAGPTFGFKDARYGCVVIGSRSQAVDCLGRESHQLAVGQTLRSSLYLGGVGTGKNHGR